MKNKKMNIKRIAVYVFLIASALMFVYPLVYTVLSSLKTNEELFVNYFGIPRAFDFGNYADAFVKGNLGQYFLNSLFVVSVYVVLGLFFSSMAAFVFARFKKKWIGSIYLFFVAGMMVPIQSILIPLAKMQASLHLSDSYILLICTYLAGGIPFMIFVLTGFMKSLPSELEEAAVIDGAGFWRVYFNVILPLSKPAVATMAILGFISCWNDLILSLILINNTDMYTISLGLMNFTGLYTTDYTGLCAAIIIANLPIILIYMLLQEHVEKGLTAGAVKG